MPHPLMLELTQAQRQELERARDQDTRPYIRERAAAILKIAAGMSGRQVAFHGLLKRRRADTVYRWVHRYQRAGLSGLTIKSGGGRKPAFSPSAHQQAAIARDALLHVIRRSPEPWGFQQARWTLAAIGRSCPWLEQVSLPGIWPIMKRLGMPSKRARSDYHSPAVDYQAK